MMGKRVLMIYFTVGDPVVDSSLPNVLMDAGADLLELGLPTARPKYDGPTVRRAIRRALQSGFIASRALLESVRLAVGGKILFAYYDVAMEVGVERMFEQASQGFRAILFPDLLIDYPENLQLYCMLCERYGLEKAFFITTGFPHRLVQGLAGLEPGFIYLGLTLSTGVMLPVSAEKNIRIMRQLVGDTPLLVGFAVRTPEQVSRYVEAGANGVVIGSAVLRLLEKTRGDGRIRRVREFVSSIREALDRHGGA